MIVACAILMLYFALPMGRAQAHAMHMDLGDIIASATEGSDDKLGDDQKGKPVQTRPEQQAAARLLLDSLHGTDSVQRMMSLEERVAGIAAAEARMQEQMQALRMQAEMQAKMQAELATRLQAMQAK